MINVDVRNALSKEREAILLAKYQPGYKAQLPFPHAVLDDLFPLDIVRQAAAEVLNPNPNPTPFPNPTLCILTLDPRQTIG